MKILVIGADGQLGSDLVRTVPKAELIPLTIKDLDITKRENTLLVIKGHKPDLVINTAGYSRVDDAEDHQDQAFAINAEGAANVALACLESGAGLVHISTDYVFDGLKNSPYTEDDKTAPLSAYARSKVAGEEKIATILKKYFIIRSSGLFGAAGCLGKGGGNFIDSVIAKGKSGAPFKVVNDQYFSPTYTLDLAGKLVQLARTDHYGLYHIVNHGACSWYELAARTFESLGLAVNFTAIPFAELNAKAKAKRPAYSALDNKRLRAVGLDDLRPWPDALRAYLMEKGL
ncbi:MAG: dTDP-4-dehydrorhamnose reductase [Candidatus Margulisiibacteriota bacterium]|jgi:dTDP-4-dehydrorhamnose reductase